jgi:hypothetical protein
MVAIPTIQDEDAKRPNREHESLVGEESRIVNRMKAALIRLGIRGFNPKLKKAAERLDGLRTPEGEPIPREMHMQRPPPGPEVAHTAPSSSILTAYDEQHLITYLRLLDAHAEGADWREIARTVLHLDPEHESDRSGRRSRVTVARQMDDGTRLSAPATLLHGGTSAEK